MMSKIPKNIDTKFKNDIIDELHNILIYCKSSMKSKNLGVCKLQIKQEIEPRVTYILEAIKTLCRYYDKRG